MNPSDFVHLHTHSHYSLLDGLSKIDELIERTKELGMSAVALTDHGVLYGAIEFYTKAKAAGIKPILGCELYITTDHPEVNDYYHLIVLAENLIGYQNLLKLVSIGYLEGFYYKPRITKGQLASHSNGLIALSGCLRGEISREIIKNDIQKAEDVAKKYLEIFGKDNFYLELQDHQLKDQLVVNEGLLLLSKKLDIPIVVTNDAHYIVETDAAAQDVLLCVQTGKVLSDNNRLSMRDDDYSLKDPNNIFQSFYNYPEGLANTKIIADRCNVELSLNKLILPEFTPDKDISIKDYFEQSCEEGFIKKYGKDNKLARDRLIYELSVIEKMAYESYFLIVADFVIWAKKQGIFVGPGRGSAAGSIVAYVLGITDIDPLVYGLLFERFLNPDRIAPPDIDLDFADDRRDEVIDYVRSKYGVDKVAQIITFGTMEARQAIRDVGRVMNMTYGDVDKIAKLIPFGFSLEKSLRASSDLRALYESDEQIEVLINLAKRLEGVARHTSIHAAGVVISKEPLINYVPLQYATRGDKVVTTQYSMYDLEKLGLQKMDFLGLKNLTILQNALRIIKKTQGIEIDLLRIPLDDKKTFELLSKGETTGVFQLSSDGMKHYIKELQPNNIEDIIAMVSLYRPGPIEFIPDYINGKKGKRVITYLHPKLEPILKDTYGIAVYQEQVMQIARQLAGYTLAEADILRKAIGKKIKKLLMEQQEKFIEGCVKNGISQKIAQQLFSFMEPFARYGFNKSHAACYAMIAYQTAYLKAHYFTEFMAALMISDQKDLDKVAVGIEECKVKGVEVLPPDVNESFVDFGVVKESNSIRFGLAAIKNVGEVPAQLIVEERKTNGQFLSLENFTQRIAHIINKKILESLIKSGALDKFGERNQLLVSVETILKYASSISKSKQSFQGILFEQADSEIVLARVEPINRRQRLLWEKEFLGIYVSDHPLKEYAHLFEHADLIRTIQTRVNQYVKIVGIIVDIKNIITKNGQPMSFATVEDLTGKIELVIFPKIFQEFSSLLIKDSIIICWGKVSEKDGVAKILVDKLSANLEEIIGTINIQIPRNCSEENRQKIKELLRSMPGSVPVDLKIPLGNTYREISKYCTINPDKELLISLRKIIGENGVMISNGVEKQKIL